MKGQVQAFEAGEEVEELPADPEQAPQVFDHVLPQLTQELEVESLIDTYTP